jgi:hypothetical protein
MASALALAACANRSDAWYRAATPPDQSSSDERACRDEAGEVARAQSRRDANILQDRSSGAEFGSASIYRSDLNINRNEQLAVEERTSIRELTRACMADRGYRLMRDN